MNNAVPKTSHKIIIEEHQCPRPDGTRMLVRVARPQGNGPFPALIDVHGGGWIMGDRSQNAAIDDALAVAGIVAAAPEFRMPPEGRYPTSIADVHLAIRWLKANARSLASRSDLVGGLGTSSGGHQLLLCLLRPDDPRYSALAFAPAIDARLGYAVACWPVADPLRRFYMAKERQIKSLLDVHAAYWVDEAAMQDGNPQRLIESRERGALPPLLVIQGTNDDNLPADMASRFVAAYRNAGGDATLREFEGQPHAFVTREPNSQASAQALKMIADFVHQHAPCR